MNAAGFIIMLFFWGLSAGTVARIKGGSFLIWFLIGFCLPILGTLAALAFRWENRELRRQCEECGNVVALHDQVCMRCGADLEFPDVAIAPRAARPRVGPPVGE